MSIYDTREGARLLMNREREGHWNRWGPYFSERAWGTVREDYSADGGAWGYFPHDHARSRAYRWNEDGIAGICDWHQYLCFALALWNGRDPILKERLFGLTGTEGNHGEDVKGPKSNRRSFLPFATVHLCFGAEHGRRGAQHQGKTSQRSSSRQEEIQGASGRLRFTAVLERSGARIRTGTGTSNAVI
jgi:hypothetical protein